MEQLQTEHGVFTNNEVTGQTAQEVYEEWLQNKDKPPQPTETEILRDYVLELDYRLILMELGI